MPVVPTCARLDDSMGQPAHREGVTNPPPGARVARRSGGASRCPHRPWTALLLSLIAAPAALLAQPSHTYFVPLPEEQIRTWAIAIDQGALGVGNQIHTVVSLTATLDSTLIYYDHWEDDFEYDLANPVQASTEIWGDQDCSNGFTPLLGACTPGVDDALDVVMGGDVVALENDVQANPRNPSIKYWDGGDKIGSSNLLAMTRAGWPTLVGSQSGVVLAGAVEVYVATDWGTAFESPVGEDIATNDMFEYTALAIMAQADNTFVEVDTDDDGTVDISQWLQEGESLLAEAVQVGATVNATRPVQADIVTGDVNTTYEARWFALVPTDQWSDVYYSPVGETNAAAKVTVLVYNPAANPIDVKYETLASSGSFPVPAGGVHEYTMPANSGARLAAATPGLAVWSATSVPENNRWNGAAFAGPTPSPPVNMADRWRIMQGAAAPNRSEMIVVGIESGGDVSAQRWDGSSWTDVVNEMSTALLGTVSQTYWWGAEVAYEQQSGDAMLVWNDGASLRYSVWDGVAWSPAMPATISSCTSGEPRHMQLAANPLSDEMILVVNHDNETDCALIWDGSSWGHVVTLATTTTQDRTDIAVAYGARTGEAVVVFEDDTDPDIFYRTWNGSAWSAPPFAKVAAPAGVAGYARWAVMASDPNSGLVVLGVQSSAPDGWVAVWEGQSGWGSSALLTESTLVLDANTAPNLAVAFEGASGEALATYGRSNQDRFFYRTWSRAGGWTSEQVGANLGQNTNSMRLDANPAAVDEIMLSVQDDGSDLNYILWDGSGWGPANELETNTSEIKNQPFVFLWNDHSTAQGFYALSAVDHDSTTHDWGFSLVPGTSLATAAQAGWAPGSSDLSANGSPVWVTAEADTTLYIDYDGDGSFDTTSALSRLQSLRIFDPDRDQTGMRVFTTDGTRIAAAWGQDPGTAGPGSPYLDLGTTVLPFINPLLFKDVELYDDQNGNGVIEAGDTLLYTLTIKNVSAADFIDGVLLDAPDPNTTYVPSTTRVDGVLIADDSLPATPYPLDETGYDLPTPITPGQTVVVTYQMEVNDPLPPGVVELVNDAKVTAGDASTSATASSRVLLPSLVLAKSSDAIGQVSPGQIIRYTVTVENISSMIQTDIRVTDFLPLGTSYVAESTLVTTPGGTLDNVPGGVNPDLQDGSLPALVVAADHCDLAPAQSLTVTYELQVDDPLDPAIAGIFNYARARSYEMSDWVADSTFNEAPTLAVISSLAAYPGSGGVVVEWETTSEVGTAGFYLYRWDERKGEHVLVNEALLPAASGAPQGAVYRLLDEGAMANRVLEYALVEVEARGVERSYGPFAVAVDWSRELPEMPGRSLVVPRAASPRSRSRVRQARGEAAARASLPPAANGPPLGPRPALRRTETWLELTTREAGLYRLGADEMAAAFGLPLGVMRSRIAAGELRLANRGHAVSWWAEQSASAIGFYGEAIDSLYGLDNVYWLRLGKGPSPASNSGWRGVSSRFTSAGSGFAAEATFPAHLHFERDRIPGLVSARDPEADYWFWEGIAAGDATQGRKSFSLSVPGLAWESGAPAELGIAVESVSDTPSSSDHHLVVRLNGAEIGETRWDGAVPHQATFEASLSLLREGENIVEVEGLLDGTAPYSLFFIDSFDLSYQRLYQAENDRLLFTPESAAGVTIAGFASPSVRVYDVTEPAHATAVESVQTADGRVRLEVAAGRTYLAVGDLALASPAIRPVEIDPRSDLLDRGNAADYLLIAPDWLAEGAQALADLRRGDGLEARVVALEEVYRQFNHGLASPHALASFLEHAYREWRRPPRYVVLVGAGTFDYKDLLGRGGNLVPPMMVGTPWGLFASDVGLGDVGAGGGPEIAIGRLPVLSAAELAAYVEKLGAYESRATHGRALLLADDPDAGGDYVAASDAIAGLLGDWEVAQIYLSREPLPSARERLFAALDRGVSLVNYVGHGGTTRLAHEGLLTDADLPLLAHLDSPPVLAALTCVVGRFELPGVDSLAESLVLEPEGGAIAAWAPSGLSLTSAAEVLDRAFVEAWRNAGADGTLLGDAMLASLRRYADEGRHPFLWRTYNLLGDPALPLP